HAGYVRSVKAARKIASSHPDTLWNACKTPPASGRGDGAAICGPFQLLAAPPVEIAEGLRCNPMPLLKNPRNGTYYLRVTSIAVNLKAVPIPSHVPPVKPF
uniref:Uncharacterized protein n=1 Tax=Oryza glaberrima TaxID=4538 RepID=I1PCZ4_ORYGL